MHWVKGLFKKQYYVTYVKDLAPYKKTVIKAKVKVNHNVPANWEIKRKQKLKRANPPKERLKWFAKRRRRKIYNNQ